MIILNRRTILFFATLSAIVSLERFSLNEFQSGADHERTLRAESMAAHHGINSQTTDNHATPLAIASKRRRNKKVVTFVHFHKAGGTSLVQLFTKTLKPWRPNKNGNPWGMDQTNKPFLIPFWRYDKEHLDMFLNKQPNLQFLALEWNFFTSLNKQDILSRMELVTCLRDPYSRFVSNLFFSGYKEKHREQPMWWATQDLTWAHEDPKLRRPKKHDFPVNFNRPNYYVAFLNGLADQKYNWMDLNQNHLEIAKDRLHWFSAILLLEHPETHGVLQQWLPQTTKLEHLKSSSNKGQNRTIGMTREQFNLINSLDVELYEYAVSLVQSRMKQHQRMLGNSMESAI